MFAWNTYIICREVIPANLKPGAGTEIQLDASGRGLRYFDVSLSHLHQNRSYCDAH